MVVTIAAPSTQAQIAPGPASPAARQAPNSQPEPMIEPRPVSIRANGPTSRRRAEWVMAGPGGGGCGKPGMIA
ncbi:hypothetical protein NB717_001909 [Xanthomonas sacchari]|nr:hypothetical protein [Xanthomonas sacchari]